MADQASTPQVLQWGRRPDGRFQIALMVQAQLAPGQMMTVPVTAFVLTQDEEDRLMAALGGITVARSLENVKNLTLVK